MKYPSKIFLTGKILSAALLISGTSIGGGMLVLPVATAHIGFVPSISVFFITWIFMTFTAFLMLESNLALQDGQNLVSITKNILGKPGKYIAWITFLLLLYSLIAAYITGIGSLVLSSANTIGLYPSINSILLIVSGFMLFLVLYGVKLIDKLNRAFIFLGLICFSVLLLTITFSIQPENLFRISLSKMTMTFPIVVTAFGFHIVLPILVKYLDKDPKLLKSSLVVGSIIPLMIYVIWQYCVLGAIPFSGQEYSLDQINQSQNQLGSLTNAFYILTGKKWMHPLALVFSAIAILTSLIGVSLSLWDFLEDGVPGIEYKVARKVLLILLTFVPPLALVCWWPAVFSELLSFAGIFVAVLLGILPVWICWKGRKRPNWGQAYRAPGGNIGLLVALIFFVFVVWSELRSIL